MDLLGRHVPVAAAEQKPRQRQALTRRPKAGGAETFERGGELAMEQGPPLGVRYASKLNAENPAPSSVCGVSWKRLRRPRGDAATAPQALNRR
jgi:hypothetical protein